MNIAYVRVSTREQNTGRQLEALKKHDIHRIYEEKVSGKDTNRPELKAMLDYARNGDVVYVESFSRLARNMLDLLTIIDRLTKNAVGFVSLKESVDTTTPVGRLQLGVFAANPRRLSKRVCSLTTTFSSTITSEFSSKQN